MVMLFGHGSARAEELFVTWPGLEVDKCASAWLIKRFAAPAARFEIVARGKTVTEGIPFDIPQGKLRISHRSTTFDSVLKAYRLDDPILFRVAQVVRQAELDPWDQAEAGEALGLRALLVGLEHVQGRDLDALEKSFVIFDYLYAYFKSLEK